ncbi:tRNA endonuclease ANKZF1-like isoform X2 [Bacillus rossius redtenbacheri]|uniref:tRNA endonuclease ANKZF1-like isoform X2 n=1 Tax=Bacillus rossius redtenbacheri TaxID=93214 RepID=UPI002FDE9E64
MDYKTYKIYDGEKFVDVTRGIKVAQCMKSPESNISEGDAAKVLAKLEDLSVSETLFCSFCDVGFGDQSQQRLHYKLDWHRYNLKQSLLGRKHVCEESFLQLADDVSSISGSESETESEDGTADSSGGMGQSALAGRQPRKKSKRIHLSSSSDEEGEKIGLNATERQTYRHPSRHPKVFFENEDGKIFSLYRCLLHGKKNVQEKDDALVSLALQRYEKSTWLIIMLGGGHFAAAVFQGSLVLAHKTFHSYTVRASQGGTQSSRDACSRGSHPKSAGASMRRYNEMALAQHIQDIVELWAPYLDQCELIFHRAVGHSRSVLFGGRSPLLNKADPRLRSIPFPTRRATFSEVKRIHDVLSTLEVYGSAVDFPKTFPQSPRKKSSWTRPAADSDAEVDGTAKSVEAMSNGNPVEGARAPADEKPVEASEGKGEKKGSPRGRPIDRAKARKSPHRPLPEIVMRLAADSSDSDAADCEVGFLDDTEISFGDCLQEFGDTVPQAVKDRKKGVRKCSRKKKKNKLINDTVKGVPEAEPSAVSRARKAVSAACSQGDPELLVAAVSSLGQEAVLQFLNDPVADGGGTALHVAARCGHCSVVRKLLELGCDPCSKNVKNQPPYVVAVNKETRNVFRRFMGEFPDKYDYTKSQISSPLSDELEQKMAEKRREMRKVKREKDKLRKQEEDKRREEESEKERFLRLSDREKMALAAERRMLDQAARFGGAKPAAVRCFLCGADVTGRVPFEYSGNIFCTMICLKAHRVKGKPHRL